MLGKLKRCFDVVVVKPVVWFMNGVVGNAITSIFLSLSSGMGVPAFLTYAKNQEWFDLDDRIDAGITTGAIVFILAANLVYYERWRDLQALYKNVHRENGMLSGILLKEIKAHAADHVDHRKVQAHLIDAIDRLASVLSKKEEKENHSESTVAEVFRMLEDARSVVRKSDEQDGEDGVVIVDLEPAQPSPHSSRSGTLTRSETLLWLASASASADERHESLPSGSPAAVPLLGLASRRTAK